MTARERILKRLNTRQAQQRTTQLETYQPRKPEHQNKAELIKRFVSELELHQASVIQISQSQRKETLAKLAKEKALERWLLGYGEDFHASIANILSDFSNSVHVEHFDREIESLKDTLFKHIDVAITQVAAGIAETGTLVLTPSASEPRTLSLIPPIHIAIIQTKQLVPTLNDALKLVEKKYQSTLPTNVLFVSGPSKTADIQQTLAYGAHGPKELIVIIEDEGPSNS